ncbi:MAG: NADH-quinone oxidoreductase subunit NuoE [Candidatus Muirbacterium halophilum]|nr:NADH-quinone oxidoreductase subunit NuoE [Candidatus Muirbacterium halophilum]MCK9476481.1 NADH-quinone oxidoreductase subunit NuoE [Candidatus Muirbacterium halophilum]
MTKKVSKNMKKFARVCEILEKYNFNSAKLIPILSETQDEYRYLPEEVMNFIATSLNIPPANVYGVATFYSHFAFKPKGKYIIKICDGTACHVRSSIPILKAIRKHLNLSDGQTTTHDLMFTIETVSCLGACGLAPVIMINEDVHGMMDPQKAVALLDEILNTIKEAGNE